MIPGPQSGMLQIEQPYMLLMSRKHSGVKEKKHGILCNEKGIKGGGVSAKPVVNIDNNSTSSLKNSHKCKLHPNSV
jgi:hypothetical protein